MLSLVCRIGQSSILFNTMLIVKEYVFFILYIREFYKMQMDE